MYLAVKPLLAQCYRRHRCGLSTADDSNNFVVHNAPSEIQTSGDVANTANTQPGIGIDHHAA